jgi:hypothetical protein
VVAPEAATPEGPPPDQALPAPLPSNPAPPGGTRLEKHLKAAAEIWTGQLAAARASSSPAVQALIPKIQEHITNIPPVKEMMPPMQEVASYLASSKVLLLEMQAAGMNVAELSLQIDALMRPPRGTNPPPQ